MRRVGWLEIELNPKNKTMSASKKFYKIMTQYISRTRWPDMKLTYPAHCHPSKQFSRVSALVHAFIIT